MTQIGVKRILRPSENHRLWATLAIVLLSICVCLVYPIASLWWSENKGPYRSITEVVDLDGDGFPDIIAGAYATFYRI